MARWLACLIVLAGCTREQVPRVRMIGEVAALGGIAGLATSIAASRYTEDSRPFILGFSIVSAAGIISYALGELTDPAFVRPPPETIAQRNHRWARVLSARAAGAAREGNCARVRRLEVHVRRYDPEVHDFVFMRDPEIARCLQP